MKLVMDVDVSNARASGNATILEDATFDSQREQLRCDKGGLRDGILSAIPQPGSMLSSIPETFPSPKEICPKGIPKGNIFDVTLPSSVKGPS